VTTLADKRASSAFVATLRDEPSSASLTASFNTRTSTDNVVKVCGLATAIARAEEVIRERVRSGSRPDIFEALVSSPQLTDDASGPALYQPYIPTPIPPRASSTLPPPSSTLEMLPAPPRVPSIVVLDPHAFYHPYAPSPKPAFLPARPRRNAFGAFAIAFIAPLVGVALVIGGLSYAKTRTANRGSAMTTSIVTPIKLETPEPVVASAAPPPPTSLKAEEPPMLVVEVKALKSAPPRKRR
jgi:hypothetical protein